MKLLIIILCQLSERYLVHQVSLSRFYWFSTYYNTICQRFSPQQQAKPGLILTTVVVPLLLLFWLSLFIFGHLLYGFVGLLLQLLVFYYCLGPDNPFYPVRRETDEEDNEAFVGHYFAEVNGQLFAVVFWYIVAGALGVLFYRLVSLCRGQEVTAKTATWITNLLDWIPARITVLLYLLVGNFQQGFQFFVQKLLSSPEHNKELLSRGGLLAAQTIANDPIQIPYAESLVEHAMVVFLVFLACFTLVAWL
jgi:AmpE protein